MSKDQENALIVVLGAVAVPLTCRIVYEWTPGDAFSTTMAVVMLAWMLYFVTWIVQRARCEQWARQEQDDAADREVLLSRATPGDQLSPSRAARSS